MADSPIKDEAHRLVDSLPADATWDDLMYEIYVRETIERGLLDSNENKVKSAAELRREYGLDR
jgi:hypothetical protein